MKEKNATRLRKTFKKMMKEISPVKRPDVIIIDSEALKKILTQVLKRILRSLPKFIDIKLSRFLEFRDVFFLEDEGHPKVVKTDEFIEKVVSEVVDDVIKSLVN